MNNTEYYWIIPNNTESYWIIVSGMWQRERGREGVRERGRGREETVREWVRASMREWERVRERESERGRASDERTCTAPAWAWRQCLSGMRKHALSDLLPKPRSPAEALRVCPATSQPRQSSSNRGSARRWHRPRNKIWRRAGSKVYRQSMSPVLATPRTCSGVSHAVERSHAGAGTHLNSYPKKLQRLFLQSWQSPSLMPCTTGWSYQTNVPHDCGHCDVIEHGVLVG
jgi:hypothetical protein